MDLSILNKYLYLYYFYHITLCDPILNAQAIERMCSRAMEQETNNKIWRHIVEFLVKHVFLVHGIWRRRLEGLILSCSLVSYKHSVLMLTTLCFGVGYICQLVMVQYSNTVLWMFVTIWIGYMCNYKRSNVERFKSAQIDFSVGNTFTYD